MTVQKYTPVRIRVAQDADGFWTCRESVSGSQEYVRSDIADEMMVALEAALSTHGDQYSWGCAARAAISKAQGHHA